MKIPLRSRVHGNYIERGNHKEHTITLWDLLGERSRTAVKTVRKRAKA